MERKEFLKSLSASAVLAISFSCLGSCLREEIDPNDIDTSNSGSGDAGTANTGASSSTALFTIDLTSSEASKLTSKGGYIIKQNVVVAKNLNGEYVAATVICSHDLIKQVTFKNNEYYCTKHGARFDQNGKGLNNDAKKGLKIYKIILDGNILSILS